MSEPNSPNRAARSSTPRPAPDTYAPAQTGGGFPSNPALRSKLPAKIGRFVIRNLLGEGAFARVYLGYDPDLEREVAIKVPKVEELTPDFRDTFLRDARLAGQINHTNVCPIYEVGSDGGVPYIVMRVVPNTLAGVLSRLSGPMPARNAVAIARKLALGLTAAHAQKVIHRDLKPANVLYDEANREVLIADFGLARLVDRATEASNGVPKGTPADVRQKLVAACAAATKEPAFAEAMKHQGTVVQYEDAKQYNEFLKRNDALNKSLAQDLGMLKR